MIRFSALYTATILLVAPLAAQEVVSLPGQDRPLALGPSEVYRVGGAGGSGWQELARVTQMAFDEQGNLYVLDTQSQRVIVVGPEGDLVRSHDLQGEGPGEFKNPVSLAVSRAGELVVFDVGHMAFLRFAPDGRFLEQKAHSLELGIPIRGFSLDERGRVLFGSDAMVMRSTNGGASAPPADRRPIRRVDLDGESSVAYEAWKLAAPERPSQLSAGNVRFAMGSPDMALAPGLHYGLLPGGRLAVADSVDYAVKVVGSGGRAEQVLRRPIGPRRLTEADRKTYKEQGRAEIAAAGAGGSGVMIVRGGGGSSNPVSIDQKAMQQMMEDRLEATEFAEQVPVIQRMATDWEGRVWVERTARRIGEDGPIDVLSLPDGYLGTVPADGMRLPMAFGPDGRLAYVELDELDIPTVVVRRLPAALR